MGRGKKSGVAWLLVLICLMGVYPIVGSQTTTLSQGIESKIKNKNFDIEITGIDAANREKVTRISVNLVGVPHTSQRIDGAALILGQSRVEADDIDGVDFKRYFQWEDEGIIPVDIDFPTLRKINPGDSIIFYTATGPRGWRIGEKTVRK